MTDARSRPGETADAAGDEGTEGTAPAEERDDHSRPAEDGANAETSDESPPTADETTGGDPASTTDVDPESLLEDGPVLLFDGVCNLCNWTVQFVIRRDPEGHFRFAPLQSEAGQALLEYADVDVAPMESFVMVDRDGVYVKSDAGLHVLEELGLPWSLAYPLIVFPRFVRNLVYDFVAANRYRVFGRKEQCMIPDEDVSDRFLG